MLPVWRRGQTERVNRDVKRHNRRPSCSYPSCGTSKDHCGGTCNLCPLCTYLSSNFGREAWCLYQLSRRAAYQYFFPGFCRLYHHVTVWRQSVYRLWNLLYRQKVSLYLFDSSDVHRCTCLPPFWHNYRCCAKRSRFVALHFCPCQCLCLYPECGR